MQINEKTHAKMPPKLQALFEKMPNPGSDEVVRLFPETGPSKSNPRNNGDFKSVAKGFETAHVTHGHDDNGGSAARFFYCAKESDRDVRKFHKNRHPTVKPFTLMRYLTRLVQPPSGGVIFDPFCGSGSTGVGAIANGSKFIGIDIDSESLNTASVRLADGVKNRFVTIKDKKRR